jgi:hypothetical protein
VGSYSNIFLCLYGASQRTAFLRASPSTDSTASPQAFRRPVDGTKCSAKAMNWGLVSVLL